MLEQIAIAGIVFLVGCAFGAGLIMLVNISKEK